MMDLTKAQDLKAALHPLAQSGPICVYHDDGEGEPIIFDGAEVSRSEDGCLMISLKRQAVPEVDHSQEKVAAPVEDGQPVTVEGGDAGPDQTEPEPDEPVDESAKQPGEGAE